MTITKEQLDELERLARSAQHSATVPNRYFRHPDAPMAVAWSPVIDGRDTCVPQSHAYCYRNVDADFIAAASPDVALQLVAIARAAMAVDAALPDTLAESVAAQVLRKALRGAP